MAHKVRQDQRVLQEHKDQQVRQALRVQQEPLVM